MLRLPESCNNQRRNKQLKAETESCLWCWVSIFSLLTALSWAQLWLEWNTVAECSSQRFHPLLKLLRICGFELFFYRAWCRDVHGCWISSHVLGEAGRGKLSHVMLIDVEWRIEWCIEWCDMWHDTWCPLEEPQERQMLSKAEGLELAISSMHQQHLQQATRKKGKKKEKKKRERKKNKEQIKNNKE